MKPEINPPEGRTPVKVMDGIRFVKPEKIILITSKDKQTVVYIKNEEPIQSQTPFKCFKERLL